MALTITNYLKRNIVSLERAIVRDTVYCQGIPTPHFLFLPPILSSVLRGI
jgi:hypothetical protein